MIEFEQKDLAREWGQSLSTVIRVVRRYGGKPVRRNGLRPVFSAAQVETMYGKWQRHKEQAARRLSRRMKQVWRARKSNGFTHAILSVAEVKRRAR